MTESEIYTQYTQYVEEEWESGHINELEESGFIIPNPEFIENGIKTISYRLLTENEFMQHKPIEEL